MHKCYVTEHRSCLRCVHTDAMNLCLSLTTQGFEDTAFTFLKTFPNLHAESQGVDLGNFLLRHYVNMNKVRRLVWWSLI